MKSTETTIAINATRNQTALQDAITASQALASRERQDAAAKKRGGKGKVSLGGSLAPTPRYVDKAVRFTEGGYTKVRTVSVNDPDEIPNLTLDQKADLRRQWDREASAAKEAKGREGVCRSVEGIAKDHKLTGVDDDGVAFKDATPERLNQARAGQDVMTVAGVRQIADPFATLRNKRLLDKEDARINEALYQAGLKFRSLRASAFPGIKAMDLTKDIVDGGLGHDGCPATDHAMDARKILRDAFDAVGSRLMPYLMGVVVEDRPVESLSGLVAESKNATLATMLAVERLRQALHQLATLWRLYPDDRPRAISSSIGQENMRNFERRSGKGG